MENLTIGTEVTINIPFTYVIGDTGEQTGVVLNTIQDCKNEVLNELGWPDEPLMNVQIERCALVPEFIQNIDWVALREQKNIVHTFSQTQLYGYLRDHVAGIIHLIDAIQDYAVDVCKLDETLVFGNITKE